MYENMKAKDAAKIFDRLEIKILVEVATQINPRRMSDILAQMSPEAAERLTVELAARSGQKGQAGRAAQDRRQARIRIDGCAPYGGGASSAFRQPG